MFNLLALTQGDQSGCSPSYVDIKTKVALQCMFLILNTTFVLIFCFYVNITWGNNLNGHPIEEVANLSQPNPGFRAVRSPYTFYLRGEIYLNPPET